MTTTIPKQGQRWLKEHEATLEGMVQEGKSWNEIAEALGRTPSACKARLGMLKRNTTTIPMPVHSNIETRMSQMHQISTSTLVSTTTQESNNHHHTLLSTNLSPAHKNINTQGTPWSPEDELLLLQFRAIKLPYKYIAGLLSTPHSLDSIYNHYHTLKSKNIGYLDDYYKKIGHPYASTSNNGKESVTLTATNDRCHTRGTENKLNGGDKKVEDIVYGIDNLQLNQQPVNHNDQQTSLVLGSCHYCRLPASTINDSQQYLCPQCKRVLEHYTSDTLSQLMHSIKTTSATPKKHIPISDKDHNYILDTEYEKYVTLDIPKRIQSGIEMERPRASRHALLNIAKIKGLMDDYTNIKGYWIPQQDSCNQLEFGYFKNQQGQVQLKPSLSIIAHLSIIFTEEEINTWINALKVV
ncbi:hypothetical protein BC941DRAFT_471198 [Chlamydoabsidia padenii]|nr:hypothetical protein BC941DRAFT_471198 [Chlamydoabsidia padenii]